MTNWLNPLHTHRNTLTGDYCCDYYCLDYYFGKPQLWNFLYDVQIADHSTSLIGQDYILCSHPDFVPTRNVLFDLLIPDALFHVTDGLLWSQNQTTKGEVYVLPARTTVLYVDNSIQKTTSKNQHEKEKEERIEGKHYITPVIKMDGLGIQEVMTKNQDPPLMP